MKKLAFYWRFSCVMAHVFKGLFICFFIFPWVNEAGKKARIKNWSAQLLAIFRVRVDADLTDIASGAMIVSNHVSWLDIFVINSLAPCQFVAKSDIRSWPLLGWLALQAGTIYISRGSKSDVKRIYQHLIDQILAGERVAFFPEGTTAAQGDVLPFHANLFEAAIHAKVPVHPFALRYLDQQGQLHKAVDFLGEMTFLESMTLILNGGTVTAELRSLPLISTTGAHRRDLAAASRVAVAAALNVEIRTVQ